MSKFKVLDGDNVVSIADRNRQIKELEFDIKRRETLNDRDLVTFAYHFVRLEHPLLAQKYLNKLSDGYFEVGVYKDLYQALLSWSITHTNPQHKYNQTFSRAYEYFLVVRRAITAFDQVHFAQKPSFEKFKKEFEDFNRFVNSTYD